MGTGSKKAAVVIGVDKTGDLPVLKAAAKGAEKFAAWACGQGYEVALITDNAGTPVTVAQIYTAVAKVVEAQTYSQLLIFFSGHGILKAPDCELWLLSGSPDNPNEAVNVSGSIWAARNSGILYLVFVSDACRSSTERTRLTAVTGSTIFPNNLPQPRRPEVDVFYATLPGEPSYEVPAAQAVANFRGLFTDCLLQGLLDRPFEVMEERTNPRPACWVITGWGMKNYLDGKVPDAAAEVSIRLLQNPDIRVESHLPTCLVECSDYQTRKRVKPFKPGPLSSSVFSLLDQLPDKPRYKDHESIRKLLPGMQHPSMIGEVQQLLGAKGRLAFETRTGFTVVGASVRRATAGRVPVDVFEENQAFQLRVHWSEVSSPGGSILIQFASGTGTVLAILSGFIGTIVVEKERVVNVSYVPSRHTENYPDYERRAGELAKLHAYVATAARNGVFRLEPFSAKEVADRLRIFKGIDPTLGIFAAYAYAQAGAFDSLRSVYDYMAGAPEPVPFDVALLADKLPPGATLVDMRRVAPLCPMLTQGWSLLGPNEQRLAPELRQAHAHLLPSLWTTLYETGVDLLWADFEQGTLR